MLANAVPRFTDLVNGTLPARGPRGFGGARPAAGATATTSAYAGLAI